MNIREFVKKSIAGSALFALALMQIAFVAAVGPNVEAQVEPEGSAVQIYDNGGIGTGATSNSGVAAPAGTQWSEDPNPFGNTQQANTSAGVSCSVTATVFRCADDFNVPAGQTWTINQVVVFAYQTGFAGATSPITAATLRIWNGRPGDAGATIVFGDTTTNRLASSVDSGIFRIFSTVVGTGAAPPTAAGTTRKVWQTNLTVSPALVLTSGTYWIDWNTSVAASAAHFAPSVTYKGIRGIPGQTSRQFSSTTSLWTDITDVGQFPTGAPTPQPYPQDFPFKLMGTVGGASAVRLSRVIDFDGDNKSDFAIARSPSAAGQSTWWLQNSGGGGGVATFGLGIGFPTGDKATPADFDGDGKTDIAVWRTGGPGAAAFYILQSQTNTIRASLFGMTGDDPALVGDYDGDGKADEAVYRPGASQSTFYYRGSLSNPSGAITAFPWGLVGDVPIPGDFDGDRKFDFHVARNSGGQMTHYESATTAGVRIFPFGLNTDKFSTGDFDADARTDLMVARANGAEYDWYIRKSSTSELVIGRFGSTTSSIAPGDYDGDGRTDFAVWRSGAQADFYLMNTGSSPVWFNWGTTGDFPVANFSVK